MFFLGFRFLTYLKSLGFKNPTLQPWWRRHIMSTVPVQWWQIRSLCDWLIQDRCRVPADCTNGYSGKIFLSSSEVEQFPVGATWSAMACEGIISHCHRGQKVTLHKQMRAEDIHWRIMHDTTVCIFLEENMKVLNVFVNKIKCLA